MVAGMMIFPSLSLFGQVAKRDTQGLCYPFAICRVSLQTITYVPQFDFPWGITHCPGGIAKKSRLLGWVHQAE
jgi:hypothetical protein